MSAELVTFVAFESRSGEIMTLAYPKGEFYVPAGCSYRLITREEYDDIRETSS